MPDKISFFKTFRALENAVNIAQQKNKVIASNLSNAETPRYRAKDVDFKTTLARTLDSGHELNLARTNSGHFGSSINGSPRVESFEDDNEWNGYNWVNIDKEMTKLSENNLIYRVSVEALLRKIAILKEVINQGGR